MDIVNESYKGNIKGKTYRLIYEVNKQTNISVRTSVGDSDKRKTEENIGQGSLEAFILSSSNLSWPVS